MRWTRAANSGFRSWWSWYLEVAVGDYTVFMRNIITLLPSDLSVILFITPSYSRGWLIWPDLTRVDSDCSANHRQENAFKRQSGHCYHVRTVDFHWRRFRSTDKIRNKICYLWECRKAVLQRNLANALQCTKWRLEGKLCGPSRAHTWDIQSPMEILQRFPIDRAC